ncbi:MAG TPA: ECF transporter S component [Candidatus Limnocylindria bacterium]|nr:ECF transporter S component [Candidatus Limnocylindria bacterium]
MNRTNWSWRTVDIVVAAAIAIAFGVVFWAWNQLWAAAAPAFVAIPPAQNILYGVWLVPAVLAGLIIRKPGAALFTELVAASVSAILGSQWGLDAVVSGALQGLGAEIVFVVVGYRRWTIAVALIAAIGTAIAAWVHDTPLYYADIGLGPQLVILAFMVVSAIVIAGIGSWLLMRSLVQTGVLAQFPAGRAQQRV